MQTATGEIEELFTETEVRNWNRFSRRRIALLIFKSATQNPYRN